ncbi:MAG: hypothetical protein VYC39_20505 [Myxococcota bacterium]|nr:hypothetical protein [Myxococcota bacterium]
MRLSRVEFEGGQGAYDLTFRTGLNVVVCTSKTQEQVLLQSLCAALSLSTQNTESTNSRMRVEFFSEDNKRYCCDLSNERDPIIYSHADDSTRPTMSSIMEESIDKDSPLLNLHLLRVIAGLSLVDVSRNNAVESVSDANIRAWENERQLLQRKYNHLRELELQLKALEPDLALVKQIARLPGELRQRLDTAPALLNRFTSREGEISEAKDDVVVAIASDKGVEFDSRVAYAFVGMVLSFVLAEVLDFPMIALLNLFFAVFIANRLFQNIEQLESTARVNARGRAVSDAERRISRKKLQTNSDLDVVSKSLGVDRDSISRVMSSSEEITEQATQIRQKIKKLEEGASSDETHAQLVALGEKISLAHARRVEQKHSVSPRHSTEQELSHRLDQDLFRALTRKQTAYVSRESFEQEILKPLMKLSEGRYDGATVSEEGRITVVGPDDVFPVSFTRFDDKDKALIEAAMRLGAISAILNAGTNASFVISDRFARSSETRRTRFREAIDILTSRTQMIVVSSTDDWTDANVIKV